MKVLFVNVVCGVGSTGRIVTDLCAVLRTEGHSFRVAYGYGTARGIAPEDSFRTVGKGGYYAHNALSRLTDHAGFYSTAATRRLIRRIEEYDPDLIHLHNLHGYYLNVELLFDYLRRAGKPVIWTLHDCWPFTGHCAYFDAAGCDRWKSGCRDCTQLRSYPKCFLGGDVARNYARKKAAFCGVERLVFVTPSHWLAGLVGESFLGDYPVRVIHNGIDRTLFCPQESDLRRNHGWENRKLVLAVASEWNARKGMQDVFSLARKLGPDYQTVMVGVRKEQLSLIPPEVYPIRKTGSAAELAQLYAAADVLVNPTYEDNFPTVNLEALACGTPVLTYRTGGSVEAVDESCGIVVERGDVEAMCRAVPEALKLHREDARRRSRLFDREDRYRDYLSLYREMLGTEK